RERVLRTTLTNPADRTTYLRDVRALVAEYEAVVHRFPAGSYGDESLWHAGRLALDTYGRFGDARDRDAGVRLLRRLTTEYPASQLVSPGPGAPAPAPARAAVASPPAALPALRPVAARLSTIKGITRTVLPDVVRVVVQLDAEVLFRDERAAD